MKTHVNHRAFDVTFSLSFVSVLLAFAHAGWNWNVDQELKFSQFKKKCKNKPLV